jgi:hypothetical protein
MSSTTSEVFAAMGEAVAGNGGKSLQRKFKVCTYTSCFLTSAAFPLHLRQIRVVACDSYANQNQ